MTKKDYISFARMIFDLKIIHCDNIPANLLIGGICDVFASDNARFDRDRFKIACDTNIVKG